MWLEENILADTLSYVHLEEATYDTPKEKLTAQVNLVYQCSSIQTQISKNKS